MVERASKVILEPIILELWFAFKRKDGSFVGGVSVAIAQHEHACKGCFQETTS